MPDRPERPNWCRAIVAVNDLNPEALAADATLDLLAQVSNAEHDTPCAVLAEQPELVDEKRLSRDLNHRLWRVADVITQPRSEPTGKNADRWKRHAVRHGLDRQFFANRCIRW